MHITTLPQATLYLESFIRPVLFKKISISENESSDPLSRMRLFLSFLNNPHQKFPSVIVTGTSGKGSTAYLLSHILTQAGYKTGFTLSPHLQTILERFQINNQQIAEATFVALVNEIIPAIEKMRQTPLGEPSYFEILIAVAFLYFAQEKVDIAVVEVGIEGKYDATSVLTPLMVILTNISLDHTAILGETTEQIADEATEVIHTLSPQGTVITGIAEPPLFSILQAKNTLGSQIKQLGKEFTVSTQNSGERNTFTFTSHEDTFTDLSLSLRGAFQITNAALVIEAVLQLKQYGFSLSEQQLRHSLKTAFFPGRFEVIQHENKTIILDGAHNPAKMQAFMQSLESSFPQKKKLFLLAFKENKDVVSMLQEIVPYATQIIATEFHVPTDLQKFAAMKAENIARHIPSKEVICLKKSEEAVAKALSMQEENTLLVITGSLYLVGEIRTQLQKMQIL